MNISELEKKYNYKFDPFFKKLWNAGLLDWFKGWKNAYIPGKTWLTEVYPKIKDNPPILLHTGLDFEMLPEEEMLNYEFNEWNDPKHKFIPFAMSGAGDCYAIYANIEIDGNNPIVLVWHDDNATDILSKNLEDFIFRQMIEKIVTIDKSEIDYHFNGDNLSFQKAVKLDLKSVENYLKPNYVRILTEIYNRDFTNLENIISREEMEQIFKETIHFELMDTSFKHELEEN